MKRASLILMLLLLTVAGLFAQTSTTVPQLVHYTGTLTAANGKPVTEPLGVTFLIYSEPDGGEALWMETQEIHPDEIGHYAVELGAASQGLPADLFTTAEARWLAIQTPGQLETARQRLVSVPYALKAGDAETFGGLPLSAFVLAKDNKAAGPEMNSEAAIAPKMTTAATTTTTGTVTSVSLSAPTSDFSVSGNPVTKSGTLAFKWNVAPGSGSVANSIVKRDGYGNFNANSVSLTGNLNVIGSSLFVNPMTVENSLMVGGTAKGLRLRDNGSGLDLESLGAPLFLNWSSGQNVSLNNSVGIGTSFPQAELNLNHGATSNADTFLIGNNTTKGLQMRDNGTGVDIESIGVPLYMNYATKQPVFLNPNGGIVNIGLAQNPAALGTVYCTPGWADCVAGLGALNVGAVGDGEGDYTSASFTNDVIIHGNILVEGTKNFEIDHPLDPLNKTLDHAAIESSEVLNQYSGNAILDANGQATITFPDWFSSINIDFRYQLTAIGAPGPGLYIAKEVEAGSFTIAGGQPGSKVSWQVTAKRNDVYMQAHPFQAERQKPETRRGHYTLPELYVPKNNPANAKLDTNAN